MQLFDAHAHISGEALFDDIELILQNAKDASVFKIINIATDAKSLERGLALSSKYPGFIYNTAAITPHDSAIFTGDLCNGIKKAAKAGNLVAIGETGLDYHYMPSDKEIQKKVFIKHLHFALECHLPVVIHCRDAFNDLFEILDAEYMAKPNALPGIMHCFTGSLEEAKETVERNWFVSYSGIVTFKKSQDLKATVPSVPLENILIETDAPYLAPDQLRGKKNEPSYIVHTAKVVGDLKGVSLEEIAAITWNNGKRAFNI